MENKRKPEDYVYIAKKDTWFKEGTEAKLIADCQEAGGIFRGIKMVVEDDHPNILERHKVGDEYIDEELCSYDEFYIFEK